MAFFDDGSNRHFFDPAETDSEITEVEGSKEYTVSFPNGCLLVMTESEAEQLYMLLHSLFHENEFDSTALCERENVVEMQIHDELGLQTLYMGTDQLKNFAESLSELVAELDE